MPSGLPAWKPHATFALVTRRNRIPRFLIHPSLTKFPFLADFMAKLGGIMACQENGDWVLLHRERPLEVPHSG